MALKIGPGKAPTRCPLCHEELAQLSLARCHSCATTFHQECLEEMGGCPTSGCAQRGMVPLDVDRPSNCPACGEAVRHDSYDCICGGRYHLECAYEGCIRPSCSLIGVPLGGAKRPWWRPRHIRRGAYQASIMIALAATVYMLYVLLVDKPSEDLTDHLMAAGMVLILATFSASSINYTPAAPKL